jgi:hypothetical protein
MLSETVDIMDMDKPHKQVITTYAVAIRFGQGRVHVPIRHLIPHHAKSEAVKCPMCETVFIVTDGFPRVQFLETLETQHKNKETHPDVIPSEAAWTRVAECDCLF